MFTHCGGKDRVSLVVRALQEVNVPIGIAIDFDVLNSERPLKDIFEAAGGDWDKIKADWKLVKNSIDNKKPELTSKEVINQITEELKKVNSDTFPDETKNIIQKIFKRSSPWAHAKEVGMPFVPSGDPTNALTRLTNELERNGIFVVPVGELEGFVKSIGNHGPRWVNEVLKKDLKNDREFKDSKDFVQKLIR